ncbi:MAG TPA: dienelactone hydrolase family protein [Streptosporangiaceae bacterium]|jgi:carboxymethylenebutenolidase|nr:dienelactone hydrolase family protein [Streptosporangiaceae bacterium]
MPEMSYSAPGGATVPGYLAVPAGSGPWPGVVVIHELFGVNDDIRRKADELAEHGYLALAPDLYRGRGWLRCVRAIFQQLRAGSGAAFDALDGARGYLAGRADSTGKTGVIGFCLGGGFALLCAPRKGFSAASVNYGEVPKDAERLLAGACPIVASFGGRDFGRAREFPERLERALVVLDVPHDVQVYPGSGHRFMSQASGAGAVLAKVARMSYEPHDAADSWARIYRFFGQYLS